MNLSISEFSDMCHLSPQTLRFYHSAGLLVPAEVNEQTGYRFYSSEQVEQAMLVTVLRETGMSVRLVRRAVEEPDSAPALLRQHVAQMQQQRYAQDEAVSDAEGLLTSWPEPRERSVPEMLVVSKVASERASRTRAPVKARDGAARLDEGALDLSTGRPRRRARQMRAALWRSPGAFRGRSRRG